MSAERARPSATPARRPWPTTCGASWPASRSGAAGVALASGWRWCKRNPRVAVLSSSVLLLLIAVGAVLTILRVLTAPASRRSRRNKPPMRPRPSTRHGSRPNSGSTRPPRRSRPAIKAHARSAALVHAALGHGPELTDLRTQLTDLRSQVERYTDFKRLLDNARFGSRFGSRRLKETSKTSANWSSSMDNFKEGPVFRRSSPNNSSFMTRIALRFI